MALIEFATNDTITSNATVELLLLEEPKPPYLILMYHSRKFVFSFRSCILTAQWPHTESYAPQDTWKDIFRLLPRPGASTTNRRLSPLVYRGRWCGLCTAFDASSLIRLCQGGCRAAVAAWYYLEGLISRHPRKTACTWGPACITLLDDVAAWGSHKSSSVRMTRIGIRTGDCSIVLVPSGTSYVEIEPYL